MLHMFLSFRFIPFFMAYAFCFSFCPRFGSEHLPDSTQRVLFPVLLCIALLLPKYLVCPFPTASPKPTVKETQRRISAEQLPYSEGLAADHLSGVEHGWLLCIQREKHPVSSECADYAELAACMRKPFTLMPCRSFLSVHTSAAQSAGLEHLQPQPCIGDFP